MVAISAGILLPGSRALAVTAAQLSTKDSVFLARILDRLLLLLLLIHPSSNSNQYKANGSNVFSIVSAA
jgi:hypothetical protein